ncbi:hypothetical protein ACN28G_18055 [Micromonospora sp. WMMA1923]|uniref:hypothetical protein n=1 Tax=Micromonospora sp. WMMA1923 TaxID=3404125 RepID=UPI003B953FF1
MAKRKTSEEWAEWAKTYRRLRTNGHIVVTAGKLQVKVDGLDAAEIRFAKNLRHYNNPEKRGSHGGPRDMPPLLRNELFQNGHLPDTSTALRNGQRTFHRSEDNALAMAEAKKRHGEAEPSARCTVDVDGIGTVNIGRRLKNIGRGQVKNPGDMELMKIIEYGWDSYAPPPSSHDAHTRYLALKANRPTPEQLQKLTSTEPAAQPTAAEVAAARLPSYPGHPYAEASSSTTPASPPWNPNAQYQQPWHPDQARGQQRGPRP